MTTNPCYYFLFLKLNPQNYQLSALRSKDLKAF